MRWQSRLWQQLRWKLVHGSKFPKANLPSCLLNLANRGFQPREIIDVGANRGKWSRDASHVFPNAGYTLIEPQVEMESRLRTFCEGHANRRYVLAGAGSFNGELPFTVVPDTVSSTFAASAQEAARQGLEQRTVPLVTIDHVVQTLIHAVPDIIKVDAEGFEQEVVRGATSVLGKTEVIFLEAHFLGERNDPSEFVNLITFMSERDYVTYDFSWLGRRKFDNALSLCEIAFVRRNGFLRSLQEGETKVYVPATLDDGPVGSKSAA